MGIKAWNVNNNNYNNYHDKMVKRHHTRSIVRSSSTEYTTQMTCAWNSIHDESKNIKIKALFSSIVQVINLNFINMREKKLLHTLSTSSMSCSSFCSRSKEGRNISQLILNVQSIQSICVTSLLLSYSSQFKTASGYVHMDMYTYNHMVTRSLPFCETENPIVILWLSSR